jgi:hypothetical protein
MGVTARGTLSGTDLDGMLIGVLIVAEKSRA